MEHSKLYYLVRGFVCGIVYTGMMFLIMLGLYAFILGVWSLGQGWWGSRVGMYSLATDQYCSYHHRRVALTYPGK